DAEGNYIYPEGFDPETQEWKPGYEKQRDEWERQYAEAHARYEKHMAQVAKARQAEAEAAAAEAEGGEEQGGGNYSSESEEDRGSLASDAQLAALREKLSGGASSADRGNCRIAVGNGPVFARGRFRS